MPSSFSLNCMSFIHILSTAEIKHLNQSSNCNRHISLPPSPMLPLRGEQNYETQLTVCKQSLLRRFLSDLIANILNFETHDACILYIHLTSDLLPSAFGVLPTFLMLPRQQCLFLDLFVQTLKCVPVFGPQHIISHPFPALRITLADEIKFYVQ